jgi:hypothetical protein
VQLGARLCQEAELAEGGEEGSHRRSGIATGPRSRRRTPGPILQNFISLDRFYKILFLPKTIRILLSSISEPIVTPKQAMYVVQLFKYFLHNKCGIYIKNIILGDFHKFMANI